MTNNLDMARQLSMVMLKGVDKVDLDAIRATVGNVITMLEAQGNGGGIDGEALIRDLESRFNIWIGTETILDDSTGHVPWLPDRRAEIEWKFWNRYRRLLEEEKGWAPATVNRLSLMTDEILGRLEDPVRKGQWDRRGMVVGQVQSGKTSNYAGLICKAADAGYKLIVILAGHTNSLRSQTQLRLDEGFLGFDTRLKRAFDTSNRRVGVGSIPGEPFLIANSGTNSEQNGDFSLRVMGQFNIPLGGDPLLMVVKKNMSVLRNLVGWAPAIIGEKDEQSGRQIVRDVPMLLIDDEADYASINTKVEDDDPTAINRLIRQLLLTFQQSAYVGYTATPFANIFIYPEAEAEAYGSDLFPRDFIVSIPAPSDYVGPSRVFGLDQDSASGVEEVERLPVVRPADDYDAWIPNQHRKGYQPGELPASLREALNSFVISCAARQARGQVDVHNSMLVHVTRYVDVQDIVAEQIEDELLSVQRRLRYGDGNSPYRLIDELKDLWERDFVPTTGEVRRLSPDTANWMTTLSWSEVEPVLSESAQRIQVKRINGSAKDALEYWDHPNGLNVIAIGGDKLSRGLTLEGLTVSYYLRSSRMYDTLMQMGRWFGYRPGYLDLCRLYTTPELIEWYEHITFASEELRREFDYMADTGGTPADFGLRVRTHPAGLIVTSANKMRTGVKMQLSYAGDISESIVFHRDDNTVNRNFQHVENFLRECGAPAPEKPRYRNNHVWESVSGEAVVRFLQGLRTHEASRRARSDLLSEYIRTQLGQSELTEWTVALISNQQALRADNVLEIANVKVGSTRRSDQTSDLADRYTVRRLVSPTDELIDMSEDEQKTALEVTREIWRVGGKTRKEPQNPSGLVIRRMRPKERGLLLLYMLDTSETKTSLPIIGFAASFPGSPTARVIEYAVNNVYWDQEFSLL